MRKSQCPTCDNFNKSSCWCSNHKVAMTEGTPGYFDKCSDYRKAVIQHSFPIVKRAVEDVKCRGCGATGLFELVDEKMDNGELVIRCECGHEEVL